MAKIISPKADESLMYFSENEKEKKIVYLCHLFSFFTGYQLLESSEIEIISK